MLRIAIGCASLSLLCLIGIVADGSVSKEEAASITGAAEGCFKLSVSIGYGCQDIIEDKYGEDDHGYCEPISFLHKDEDGDLFCEKVRHICDECGTTCGGCLIIKECDTTI